MTNQICKIDDIVLKIEQARVLMGILTEQCNTMPKKYQDNLVHIAFDILYDQERALLDISEILRCANS